MIARDFYLQQAELRQADADAATLENARARFQDAANAWAKLADRNGKGAGTAPPAATPGGAPQEPS